MKYDHRDIKELTNSELIEAYWSMLDAENRRKKAASHPKFQKMEFPAINPEFVELKNNIKHELEHRKIGVK